MMHSEPTAETIDGPESVRLRDPSDDRRDSPLPAIPVDRLETDVVGERVGDLSEPRAADDVVTWDPVGPGRPLSWPFRTLAAIGWFWERSFGFVSLLVILAALATVPILGLLSLGYLLEMPGRMVRTGRYRAAWIGLDRAARIGGIVLGSWLVFLPVRLISEVWYSSYLIAPGTPSTAAWRIGLLVATAVALVHCVMAWSVGGKLRHFFWPMLAVPALALWATRRLFALVVPIRVDGERPLSFLERLATDIGRTYPLETWFPPAALWALIRRGRPWAESRDATWAFLASLRPGYYFSLGLRGFLGAMIWLAPPMLLILAGNRLGETGGGPVFLILGLVGLAVVATYLPLIQVHFAASNRWMAHFEVLAVRRLFRRAPLAFLGAITVTLAFAIPLYVLKIERTPPETFWLSSLVFVAFIWPARYVIGCAATAAVRREDPTWRSLPLRWSSRLVLMPVVATYALVILATQYVCWNGTWNLLEQHAFLLPVPFLTL